MVKEFLLDEFRASEVVLVIVILSQFDHLCANKRCESTTCEFNSLSLCEALNIRVHLGSMVILSMFAKIQKFPL